MRPLTLAALALFFTLAGAASGANTVTPYASSRIEITLNGAALGHVYSVSGGDARADVVTEKIQGPAQLKKHLAGVHYAPLTVEMAVPFSAPLLSWVSEFLANNQTAKTLVLTEYSAVGKVAGTPQEAVNTRLAEIRFPAFDASSKDAVRLTFVFAPEYVHDLAGSPPSISAAGTGAGKVSQANAFQVAVTGLDGSRVSRIEPFTITQLDAGDPGPGVLRDYSKVVPSVSFPNLVLTLPVQYSTDWVAWRDDFVTKGNNQDSMEKNGTLALLAADLTPLFTLQISKIGIIRASRSVAAEVDAIQKIQVELYCESMAVASAPAASSSQPKSTPSTEKKPGDAASAASPTKPNVAPNSETPTSTKASSAATSPDDKGARDPADFPRPSATTRKSYTSVRQKGGAQELAVYTVDGIVDSFESFYTKELPSSSWELVSRSENNFGLGGVHQIVMNWKNGVRSVAVTLTQTKPAAGEISVNLTSTAGL